jgi:hypothetical protein
MVRLTGEELNENAFNACCKGLLGDGVIAWCWT